MTKAKNSKQKTYCHSVEDILNLNAKTINHWLNSAVRIRIKDMKVKDLVFDGETPIRTGNGVYIFMEKEQPIYVGNCVARNFVERIPAHFDIRHNGWFNSLLVTIIKKKFNLKDKNDENLTKAAKFAFENLELILINFPNKYNDTTVNSMKELERYLRLAIEPLNGFRTLHISKAKEYKDENENDKTIRDCIGYQST